MVNYIIRRILIFIPTLVIISLLAFIISVNAPGDPVQRLVNTADSEGAVGEGAARSKAIMQELRERLGLNLPLFYFSVSSLAQPDTLHRVADKGHQAMLSRFIEENGNWDRISDYYNALSRAEEAHMNFVLDTALAANYGRGDITNALNASSFTVNSLMNSFNHHHIVTKFDSVQTVYNRYPFMRPLQEAVNNAQDAYYAMVNDPTPWKAYVPAVRVHGAQNQYHRWVFGDGNWLTGAGAVHSAGVVRGDFGISYQDQQKISSRIGDRFWWSFILSVMSIVLAYLISIPVGIYSGYKQHSTFDRSSSVILFILYSMPSFFIAVLLLMTFANPDVFDWLPEAGVFDSSVYDRGWGVIQKVRHIGPYLVLPLIALTYSSFAFLSRQMRGGMIEIVNQDYIRTARAKGLSEKKVVLKHALRNALLPIITVFANIFPAAVGGSVIIETIFTIPGMGLEVYNSILNYDYPMIVAVFTLTGFLTLVGYLVSDILYAVVDPRISYK